MRSGGKIRSHPSLQTAKSKLPRMRYTHLSQDERYQIHILNKAGRDQSEIARVMERDKPTISRELKRNCGQCGYRPRQAKRCLWAACAPQTTVVGLPPTREHLPRPGSPTAGVRSKSAVTSRSTSCPASATKASTNTSMPTSGPAAPCILPCATRRRAGSATATGKAIWSSAPASSRRW
ncbi:hypothetical protein D3871_04820 [Noviherbaspirillum saxi]|uniref:Transposase IS30-like HTH domain-containing protein n=1 Tax=Noviherbaspirillum saxi TaxID=2320863 RepID=A0A3A3FNY1_9BURK|nr:hypothetical protein D3871_04820 [Noviherbaspirillum saxi]